MAMAMAYPGPRFRHADSLRADEEPHSYAPTDYSTVRAATPRDLAPYSVVFPPSCPAPAPAPAHPYHSILTIIPLPPPLSLPLPTYSQPLAQPSLFSSQHFPDAIDIALFDTATIYNTARLPFLSTGS